VYPKSRRNIALSLLYHIRSRTAPVRDVGETPSRGERILDKGPPARRPSFSRSWGDEIFPAFAVRRGDYVTSGGRWYTFRNVVWPFSAFHTVLCDG
jgi:hypothetical protein